MTSESRDEELARWVQTWNAPETTTSAPPHAVQAMVRRRTLWLRIWLAGEILAVLAVMPLLWAMRTGDAVERAAMACLVVLTAGALAFSWWNWWGVIADSGHSMAAFVALSRRRIARLERAIRAGWVLLAGEVLVFVPWVAYRLYGRQSPPGVGRELASWGLLTAMTTAGGIFLRQLARRAQAERQALDALELDRTDNPE